MSMKQSSRWQSVGLIVGGVFLPASWIAYINSFSDITAWVVISAHLLSVVTGYWVLVLAGQGHKRIAGLSFVLLTIGHAAIAVTMLAELIPISGIPMSIVAALGWITLPIGYGLLGLYFLLMKTDTRWVGSAFLFGIVTLIVLIGREWTVILGAILLGMVGIGLGNILLGVQQYFAGTSGTQSMVSSN